MNIPAVMLGVVMLVTPLMAAERLVTFDAGTDFSVLGTFVIREGVASSRNPEIDNALTIRKVEDVIRARLVASGLRETPDSPDLIVTFRVTEEGQRGAPPPGQRGARRLNAGMLIVDMTKRDTNHLVWHGTSSDVVDSPATLAERLPDAARKLLSEFPPKKRK